MNSNLIVLYAKLESTYGTDAAPTTTDAFLVEKPTIELLGKNVTRKAVLPHFGTLAGTNIGEGIKISFNMDMLCSGTAGTAPKLGRLLRGCNMTETITASTKVDYDPNSSQSGESLTFWFFVDGQKFVINGAVGNVKLTCKSNELPSLAFDFTGIYNSSFASTVSLPTPSFGTDTGPFVFRGALFSLMGLSAPVFESFEIDLGNEVAKQVNANAASGISRYFIKGRAVKGSCDPEVVALATFNPWSSWDANTSGALSCQIGSSAGSKCIVSAPAIVLDTPKHGDREGLLTYAIGFSSHPTLTAGNNEVKFSFQ